MDGIFTMELENILPRLKFSQFNLHSLDGIDGCGKTTAIKNAKSNHKFKSFKIYITDITRLINNYDNFCEYEGKKTNFFQMVKLYRKALMLEIIYQLMYGRLYTDIKMFSNDGDITIPSAGINVYTDRSLLSPLVYNTFDYTCPLEEDVRINVVLDYYLLYSSVDIRIIHDRVSKRKDEAESPRDCDYIMFKHFYRKVLNNNYLIDKNSTRYKDLIRNGDEGKYGSFLQECDALGLDLSLVKKLITERRSKDL